jgi:serine/alanine adding enzyme
LNWAKENSIVAEFLRFHPLYENQSKILNTTIIENRMTCGISIDNESNNLSFFKSKQRNLIKSASRNVLVKFSRSDKIFKNFKNIYLNLMLEKKANKELFFSNEYFSNLYKFIKKNGFITRVISKKNNEDIGYGIFLFSDKYVHYHLSASHYKNYVPGSINLMIYKSLLFSKKLKKSFLHLGGGNSSDLNDTLFKFKKSMSSQLCTYKIGKRIFDKEFYNLNKKNWQKKYPMLSKAYSKYLLCYHIDDDILQKNQ